MNGAYAQSDGAMPAAEMVVINGRITTLDPARPSASAAAMAGGRFVAVGDDDAVLRHRGQDTRIINLGGRTAIPGLNDSHIHVIRGGLTQHT
jgi:predicted amidohydrolase YtcJ